MGMLIRSYNEVRSIMKPGDVIAFSGKGGFSDLIKNFTRSNVSHVGVIMQTNSPLEGKDDDFDNLIIESTSMDGFSGVVRSRLSKRVASYSGDMWHLPLRKDFSGDKDMLNAFYSFLREQEGRLYDTIQAIKSALDIFDFVHGPGYNHEDFSRFFCSELATAALEAAKVFGKVNVNSSEVTPIDLCRMSIFADDYHLIKFLTEDGEGRPEEKTIRRYNSLDPAGWAN